MILTPLHEGEVLGLSYVVLPWRFGRGLLALTVLFAVPIQGVLRFLYLVLAPKPPVRSAVVIGDGPIVGALVAELQRRPAPPFHIVRHLPAPSANSPSLDTEQLADVDMVIVASLAHDRTVDRLAALNFRGTTVVDAAGAYAEVRIIDPDWARGRVLERWPDARGVDVDWVRTEVLRGEDAYFEMRYDESIEALSQGRLIGAHGETAPIDGPLPEQKK